MFIIVKRFAALVATSTGLFALSFDQAFAYLDPILGSMVVQGVIGAIVTVIFFVKLYWRKLKAWFGRQFQSTPASSQEDPIDHDQ